MKDARIVRFTIEISHELYKQLRLAAAETDTSLKTITTEAIVNHLKNCTVPKEP